MKTQPVNTGLAVWGTNPLDTSPVHDIVYALTLLPCLSFLLVTLPAANNILEKSKPTITNIRTNFFIVLPSSLNVLIIPSISLKKELNTLKVTGHLAIFTDFFTHVFFHH